MPETVVYILGAGFSAPLGLPLVNNFILRSKDLYAANNEEFASFAPVFEKLDAMAKVKNFFSSDLSSIEEVLSILEMDTSLRGGRSRESFSAYIAGVIKGLTPRLEPPSSWPGNWEDWLFGGGDWEGYGRFAANLLQLSVVQDRQTLHFRRMASDLRYHVVSLNYDLVLESIPAYLRDTFRVSPELDFMRPSLRRTSPTESEVALCKLHGSVDDGVIVPPTWNKSLRSEILPQWKAAHRLLSAANHIRVVGYSLPEGDAYFRYLLKAGMLRSERLKSFDVLCLDNTGDVHARYSSFVDFPFFRFRSTRTEDYLHRLRPGAGARAGATPLNYSQLERAHEELFGG